MSTARIVTSISVSTKTLGLRANVEIFEVVWNDGGRSFEVIDLETGDDLTANSCFDAFPSDDSIRVLLGCMHENQRLDDRNQFHCDDCGKELGR